jgi:ABC-type sugar transport system substrate-binding protein
MKSVIKSAVAAAVMLGAVSAAQAETTIIVVSHGQASDPFWSVVKNGVTQAAKDFGVDVDYRAPETFDMVAMAQLIDAAVNQEPDGLIVSIPDADALGPAIQKAVAAGISVISMNTPAPTYPRAWARFCTWVKRNTTPAWPAAKALRPWAARRRSASITRSAMWRSTIAVRGRSLCGFRERLRR